MRKTERKADHQIVHTEGEAQKRQASDPVLLCLLQRFVWSV